MRISRRCWKKRKPRDDRIASQHFAPRIPALYSLCVHADLYYLPSSHTAVVEQDFESVEFSPPAAHEQVLDVIKRNAATAQTAPA
jgi:hypothetical protein